MTDKYDYIPKGGMCSNCQNVFKDCKHLKFEEMQPINKYPKEKLITVRCKEYKHHSEKV